MSNNSGPVLAVEGASDVAAVLTLGLPVVGRPSNRGGAPEIAENLQGRDLLILGERDDDPTRPERGWPGRDGAVHVAGALALQRREPVAWALPPAGAKDIRAWLGDRIAAGLDLNDRAACLAAGDELRSLLLAASDHEAPPLSVRLSPDNYGRHVATLAIATDDGALDPESVLHTGRLRIAEAADRAEWTGEATVSSASRAPWIGSGDVVEATRLIEERLDDAIRRSVAAATEPGGGDEAARVAVAERIVQLCEERYRLGVSEEGEPFAVARDGPNIALSLRGSADALRARLARDYRREYGATPNGSALADALTVLTGEAQDYSPEMVALRVAKHGDAIVIDIGDAEGRAIVLDAEGWQIVDRSPVLFRRTALTGTLPMPERGGSIEELWTHLAVAPTDRPLLVGWLTHALIPAEPHAILLLGGPQGAGKTTTASRLVMIVDASGAPVRSAPRDVRQWVIAAAGSLVVALDNVSHIPEWLSDALCRAATGDGWVDRALYTDSELAVLKLLRAIVLTSIDPGALRGDLADRLVLVDLERITEERRRVVRELGAAFDAARPRLLGAVLDLICAALKVRPSLPNQPLPRMADYGTWLAALDRVRGTDGLATFLGQGRRVAEDVVESDPLAEAVVAWAAEHSPWTGTASELLSAVSPTQPPRGWPKTGKAMSGRLKRTAPAMEALGVVVRPPDSKARPRLWSVTTRGTDPEPTVADEHGPTPSSDFDCQEGPQSGDSDGPDGCDGQMQLPDDGAENSFSGAAGASARSQTQSAQAVPATDLPPSIQEPRSTVATVGTVGSPPTSPISGSSSPTVADPRSSAIVAQAIAKLRARLEAGDEDMAWFARRDLIAAAGEDEAARIEVEIRKALAESNP